MEISLFEQALAIDPQSSVAMSGFANAYAIRVLHHMSDTKRSDLGRARELVSQAQALSPRAPLTDFVEANRLRAEGQCDNAILEYEAGLAVIRHWVGAISSIGRCKTFWAGSTKQFVYKSELRASVPISYIYYWLEARLL